MNTDPGVLFELAARDMDVRPEFRTRLVELLERSATPVQTSTRSAGSPDLIEPMPITFVAHTRRWSSKVLLLAAAIAGVIGVAGLELSRSGSRQSADRPGAECESADQLGVVDLTPTDLLIELSNDGGTFCLRLDAPSAAGTDLVAVGRGLAQSAPTEPILMQSAAGPSGSSTFFYLFEIPETVPVSEIRGEGSPTLFFASQIGRRLLVIETVDPRFAAQTVEHTWTMYSATGSSVGTLTAQGPPSESLTTRAGAPGR